MTTAYNKFYINGEWVEPAGRETIDVINPATEEAFATISMGTAEDVDAAAMAARAAFTAWSQSSVEERVAVLEENNGPASRRVQVTSPLQSPAKWAHLSASRTPHRSQADSDTSPPCCQCSKTTNSKKRAAAR